MNQDIQKRRSLRFIILLGVVSLFADTTYEGLKSIIGGYFAVLGASGTVVGVVSGFGELIGYCFRAVSGFVSDRTGRPWFIIFLGYIINQFSVPLLALTNTWPTASVFVITERFGKAIQKPVKNVMISYAGKTLGMGWAFGLRKGLDQLGSMLGPLFLALILYATAGNYKEAFALLTIPAVMAILTLSIARLQFPQPKSLEPAYKPMHSKGLPKAFWLYTIGASFVAAGFADFPLMAFHFQKTGTMTFFLIPISYAIAMATEGITSLLIGKAYDKVGFIVLIFVTIITTFFAPMVFLGGTILGFIGVSLWATGMGVQESIMSAVIGNMIPEEKRGSAYGLFDMFFGIFWFIGSAIMGSLYDISIPTLVVFIMVLQFLSIPWLLVTMKNLKAKQS